MIPTYSGWMNFPEAIEDVKQNGRPLESTKCYVCGGLVREKAVHMDGELIGWNRFCTDCHAGQGMRYTEEYQRQIDEEEEQSRRQRDADWDAIMEQERKDWEHRRRYS